MFSCFTDETVELRRRAGDGRRGTVGTERARRWRQATRSAPHRDAAPDRRTAASDVPRNASITRSSSRTSSRRAARDDLAGGHRDELVRDRGHERDVVLDEQDAAPGLGPHAAKQRHELTRPPPARHRTTARPAAAPSARSRAPTRCRRSGAGPSTAPSRICRGTHRGRGVRSDARLSRARMRSSRRIAGDARRRDREVLLSRAAWSSATRSDSITVRDGNSRASWKRRTRPRWARSLAESSGDVGAVERDGALVRELVAADDVEERRLARAVRSDESERLAVPQRRGRRRSAR